MGEMSAIAWTDGTFNPWWGCTNVSPGCDNCYAEGLDKRMNGVNSHWGQDAPRKTMSDSYWKQPIKWNKKAEYDGKRMRVFCASMADIMDDLAPDGQRDRLYDLVQKTPYIDWLFLTKRPQNFPKFMPWKADGDPWKNVWLGVTGEDQYYYNLRWSKLARYAAWVRWISYEPSLGPVSMLDGGAPVAGSTPDWIIAGGESGPRCRPFDIQWGRALRDESLQLGVKFFMKQLGGHPYKQDNPDFWPPDLRVREFPQARIQ